MIALHLLRHAHAGDPERWHGDDAERPLSEKGRRQSERLGRLLAGVDEAPDLFITSPKVRARETAELVAAALDVKVVVDKRLGGGLDLVDAVGRAHRPTRTPSGRASWATTPTSASSSASCWGSRPCRCARARSRGSTSAGGRLVAGRGQLRYLLPPEVVPGK